MTIELLPNFVANGMYNGVTEFAKQYFRKEKGLNPLDAKVLADKVFMNVMEEHSSEIYSICKYFADSLIRNTNDCK